FSFFKDPHNLSLITPSWLNFRVRHLSDQTVKQGTRISYRISWLGFSMKWESLIDRYEEEVCFADRMIRGPYRSWYHLHSFRSVADGVEMIDRVEYEMPLGPLGNIAHSVMVKRQLQAIFDYRARRIPELLGAEPGVAPGTGLPGAHLY
ncbi:MAG: SRPBCC family protein, partial [Gemmatimonadota bacterium]